MTKTAKNNAAATVIETVAAPVIAMPADLDALMGDLDALEAEAEKLAEAELAASIVADAIKADEEAAKADAPEASEDEATEEDEEPAKLEQVEHVPGDLREMLKAVTEEERAITRSYVHSAFDARLAYEQEKNPDNTRMEKNLKAYADKMTRLPLCAVLDVTNVDPDFINASIAEGKRFNVYAIDKVNDLLMALETGRMSNAINLAVMKSLFAFRKAGVPFTGLMATAAASDKVKVEAAMQKLLTRYTVSASTAPTQASSTMSALQTLGIVVNRGTQKFPVWQLTDTPQTRALEVIAA